MNKLYNDIAEYFNEDSFSHRNEFTHLVYQLTEDVVLKFTKWKEEESWEVDYSYQKTHTVKELYYFFIENIYKK